MQVFGITADVAADLELNTTGVATTVGTSAGPITVPAGSGGFYAALVAQGDLGIAIASSTTTIPGGFDVYLAGLSFRMDVYGSIVLAILGRLDVSGTLGFVGGSHLGVYAALGVDLGTSNTLSDLKEYGLDFTAQADFQITLNTTDVSQQAIGFTVDRSSGHVTLDQSIQLAPPIVHRGRRRPPEPPGLPTRRRLRLRDQQLVDQPPRRRRPHRPQVAHRLRPDLHAQLWRAGHLREPRRQHLDLRRPDRPVGRGHVPPGGQRGGSDYTTYDGKTISAHSAIVDGHVGVGEIQVDGSVDISYVDGVFHFGAHDTFTIDSTTNTYLYGTFQFSAGHRISTGDDVLGLTIAGGVHAAGGDHDIARLDAYVAVNKDDGTAEFRADVHVVDIIDVTVHFGYGAPADQVAAPEILSVSSNENEIGVNTSPHFTDFVRDPQVGGNTYLLHDWTITKPDGSSTQHITYWDTIGLSTFVPTLNGFVFDQPGDCTLSLTVQKYSGSGNVYSNYGKPASLTRTFHVVRQVPVIRNLTGPQFLLPGQAAMYGVTTTDGDGQAPTYHWTVLHNGVATTTNTPSDTPSR